MKSGRNLGEINKISIGHHKGQNGRDNTTVSKNVFSRSGTRREYSKGSQRQADGSKSSGRCYNKTVLERARKQKIRRRFESEEPEQASPEEGEREA